MSDYDKKETNQFKFKFLDFKLKAVFYIFSSASPREKGHDRTKCGGVLYPCH